MIITFVVLVVSAIFFMMGKIRSDIVALCALVFLILFDILTPEEALSGFSNSVVIMMVGLFVVGGAIFQTGLAKMISSKVLKLAGKSEMRLLLLVMLVTSALGAFVSNTGTVALMLPIVVSIAVSANISPSRFLMPMAFASSMGGMLTLIGTPPNLVIQDVLTGAGYEPLSFFSFTPVGLVCIVVGLLVLIPLSKMFLSKAEDKNKNNVKRKTSQELSTEYKIAENLYRARIKSNSLLNNKKIAELDIANRYNVAISEVRRESPSKNPFFKTLDQKMAVSNMVLHDKDILYLLGSSEDIHRFVEENLLEPIDSHVSEEKGARLSVNEIGVVELMPIPGSALVNLTVMESGFREKYQVNVLAIQRKGEYILHNLKDEKIHDNDMLLIQGTWANITRLSDDQSDWVVVGRPLEEASKVTLDYKAPVAAGIMLLMVLSMVFNVIPAVASIIIAAVLMVLTGCFRNVEDAYKTINWESIVLIAAMLPMSLALEKTGASTLVSNSLVDGLGGYGPYVLLAGVYFTTSLLTMFISNTATAVLLAPISMSAAIGVGVSPYPFLFAVAVGASMCFASPFSTPPNALVMNSGKYTFMDYIKVGLPLQLIMGIIMIFILPLIFPF